MSRGKKSGKKNVAKRGATPVKNLDKTKEKAHKEQKPSRDTDEVLRITASRWGTILALLFVALLTSLNWVSKPERCGTYSKFAPVWHLLEQYGIAKTPSDAVLKEACARVQSITHSCLFLSGRKDNVTGKLQNGLTQLWDHFSGLFDVGAGSHVPLESEVLYERHPRDLLFALTWGVILLALRGVLMQLLFLPAARLLVQKPAQEKWALPRHRRKYLRSVDRFAEQFWIAVLYGTSLMLVLVRIVSYPKCAARRQPFWPYNPEDLWHGYPHTTMDGLTKAVYLWEASNYIHQLFVLNIEARRSDYAQMGVHHLITLALIGGSYVCCFWRVGLVILLLMDPSDVLLAVCMTNLFRWPKCSSTWACKRSVMPCLALSCYLGPLRAILDT